MSLGQSYTYPRPPPTSNNLTHHQRMHLLKSTTKLARMLGAPPKLVDVDVNLDSCEVYLHNENNSIHVSLPPNHHRSPSTSSSSTRSSRSHPHSSRPSSSHSQTKLTKPLPKRPTTHKPVYAPLTSPTHPDDILASKLSSLSLEPNPPSPRPLAIPSRPEIHLPTHSRRPSTATSVKKSQVGEQHFIIETEQSQRRKKMDRLRRRLGEDVPVGLVFPTQDYEEQDSPLEERKPDYGSGEHGGGLFEDWGFSAGGR